MWNWFKNREVQMANTVIATGGGGAFGGDSVQWQTFNPRTGHFSDEHMVAMRLHLGHDTLAFQHFSVGQKSNRDRVVFIIHKDQHIVLEDGSDLFPSDDLITKMKLLLR